MRQSEERYISLLTDFGFKRIFGSDIKNSLDTAKEQGKVEGIEIGKEQGIEIGKAEGIEIGKMSGKAEEKRDTALRLLGMGLTLEQVAVGTQLTVEEVKELIKQ